MKRNGKLFSLHLSPTLRKRIEGFMKEKGLNSITQTIIQAVDEFLEKRGY